MSCARCPRAGLPCLGVEVPRLCQLVDPDHPDYAPAYASALDPGDAPPEPAPAPGLAADLADLRRARECGRKIAPACGCRYGDCTRLGREVSPRECLACLRAGDDAGAAPPA